MGGWRRVWAVAGLLGLLAACGGDSDPVGGNENEEWAEPGLLLGSWIATRVEHRRQADPGTVAVVTDTFTLVVDSVGRYTALLTPSGAQEAGWVRVMPPSVIFRPTSPAGDDAPGSLTVQGDTITIVGDSQYDFGSGTLEPSTLEYDLIPNGS